MKLVVTINHLKHIFQYLHQPVIQLLNFEVHKLNSA